MTVFAATSGNVSAKTRVKRPRFSALWEAYPKGMSSMQAYELVGGEPLAHRIEMPKAYENSCALRLSRAFNYGGLPVRKHAKSGYRLKGADGKAYLMRVDGMISFVRDNFGKPEYQGLPLAPETKSSLTGKTGVLIFVVSGWDGATGHVTLWDGNDCADHCYFVQDQAGVQTTNVQFWELK